MKFKPLLERWKKPAAPARTAKEYAVRLPLDDAARLHALVELFPGQPIEEIITDFRRHGADVFLVEVRSNVRYKLERGGVITHIGPDNVLDTLEQALLHMKQLQAAVQP